jgi:hypothetical protein
MSMVINLKEDNETWQERAFMKWYRQMLKCNAKVPHGNHYRCSVTSKTCDMNDCFGLIWDNWR